MYDESYGPVVDVFGLAQSIFNGDMTENSQMVSSARPTVCPAYLKDLNFSVGQAASQDQATTENLGGGDNAMNLASERNSGRVLSISEVCGKVPPTWNVAETMIANR